MKNIKFTNHLEDREALQKIKREAQPVKIDWNILVDVVFVISIVAVILMVIFS